MTDLWTDKEDALDLLSEITADDYIKNALGALIKNGVAVIKSAHEAEDCRKVITDYERWSVQNSEYVKDNLDSTSREKRLVDFHHSSVAAERIGNSEKILKVLDLFFGKEAGIYTSLTFKYSTQQPVHRDTPHFATWPKLNFCGVWTALEPVTKDNGPLLYYPGAHKFQIDEHQILDEVKRDYPSLDQGAQARKALDIFNGKVIDYCKNLGEPEILLVEPGDTVIWHPNLPHGAMQQEDHSLSRWSIVFHCAPIDTQVHQHQAFFQNANGQNKLPDRYGYRARNGRKIAIAGETAFM